MNLDKQVQQLKSSFSVEGVPLVNSNRFTMDEIKKIRLGNTAHSSHWNHFGENKKVWTDDEINDQIETFLTINIITEVNFNNLINNLLKKLSFKDKESERIEFINTIKTILNINKCIEFDVDFWSRFGSAPYSISKDNSKLLSLKKNYGACGMTDIFGEERFSSVYHLIYKVGKLGQMFDQAWDNNLHILSFLNLKSNYNSLDELEDNVVAKKIYEEANKFYHDRSKNFDERLKVFSKYGTHTGYIFQPKNVDLKRIFDIALEDDTYNRHETLETIQLIENWIYKLSHNRLSLDWTNQYHPQLVEKERNYVPSEEAIKRLNNNYLEKLMLEEIKSFELDW